MPNRYSIGIDLGTTNSALAYAPLDATEVPSTLFQVPQFETPTQSIEATTLPSFLYLSPEAEARGEWSAGRLARKQAADTPGRVVHSAKSWLCHHRSDRHSAFLPWRSDEIPVDQRISPIRASALILGHLREAWDRKFPESPFVEQQLTITAPASFDAVAQRLTLDAALAAGYREPIRLLEEPQAAFYRWLEQPECDPIESGHVLVIDIGGGTSDFSLFEIQPADQEALPHIKRVAVSEHLLLGGDNIDLALAHILEPRLTDAGLAPAQWNQLVARCRDVKERCLEEDSLAEFKVSIAGRGSGLFGSALAGSLSREEIEMIVLEGFFPACTADEAPTEAQAGLREWALPYTADSAVTRYLAAFLRDQPRVDAVLFNGGSTRPTMLRSRLLQQIGEWQGTPPPRELSNPEPDLAVAFGAARYGRILYQQSERIEAGAARAIYLEVQQRQPADSESGSLVCLLPRGAPEEQDYMIDLPGLELRLNRRVRFQAFSSTRGDDAPGTLVTLEEPHQLPALHTTAELAGRPPSDVSDRLPVRLRARINALGLLQVRCESQHPQIEQSWPLEFDLRLSERELEIIPDAGIDPDRLEKADAAIRSAFEGAPDRRRKLTANQVLKRLEQTLDLPKGEWNGLLLRSLWESLAKVMPQRRASIDHEETWISLAGYFLRPGFGAPDDPARVERLWLLQSEGPIHVGKRIQLQLWLLWRRVAGGLTADRQLALLHPELERLDSAKTLPPEWVRMVGAFEHLSIDLKQHLIAEFLRRIDEPGHHPPYHVALGLLLNRTPLYGRSENVVPPEQVETVYQALRPADWAEPENREIQNLFLRACRVVDDPSLDVPKGLRQTIAKQLEKAGVSVTRLERIRHHVPLDQSDRSGLFGEALPIGLAMAGPER